MGEAAGLGRGVENADLVPIEGRLRAWTRALFCCLAFEGVLRQATFRASSAAMQPNPRRSRPAGRFHLSRRRPRTRRECWSRCGRAGSRCSRRAAWRPARRKARWPANGRSRRTRRPSSRSVSAPVLTFFSRTCVTVGGFWVPRISSMALSQITSTLGCANRRSCRMRSARKLSRRCTTVTLEARLAR